MDDFNSLFLAGHCGELKLLSVKRWCGVVLCEMAAFVCLMRVTSALEVNQ